MDNRMNKTKYVPESTTSGSIAAVPSTGKMHRRTPNKDGNLFKGKVTNTPFFEEELSEEDKIFAHGKGSKTSPGLHGKGTQAKLAGFSPPFKGSGLWVSDRRGQGVCECARHGIAPEIAKALNAYVAASESIGAGGVIAGGGIGEAKYDGAIGIAEVMQFYMRATPEQKKLFKELVDAGNNAEAWKILRHATGADLELKDINENIEPSNRKLVDRIYRQLDKLYPDVVSNYGLEVVGDAILRVAKHHAGEEHNINILVREVLEDLENNVNYLSNSDELNEVKCWQGYERVRGVAAGKPSSCKKKTNEESIGEDWQKVNKRDKTDGMSKKAVKAYRRENPGSKLQTAVTKKPSKIKKGSSDDKRRNSFCARMSGNPGPMKDEHGKPTPKAKALRRWNCREDVNEDVSSTNLKERRESSIMQGILNRKSSC